MWKTLFTIMTILMLIVIGFAYVLWSLLDLTENQLTTTEAQLSVTTSNLVSTENELTGTKSKLNEANTQLTSTKTKLTDTESNLNITKAQLSTSEGQLTGTRLQLEASRSEKTKILAQYDSIRKQINRRFGIAQDCQSFVTPTSPELSDTVFGITTGCVIEDIAKLWRDYQQIYQWVVNNVKYSADSYVPMIPQDVSGVLTWECECWRMPLETLQDKTGDCEDMAVLLASMLLSYNTGDFTVWVVTIESRNPGTTGHAGVIFPVKGNKLTILDPAGNYYTGDQNDTLRADDTSTAINDWLAYWATEIPNVEITSVFSNTFYREFSNSTEFIQWMSTR